MSHISYVNLSAQWRDERDELLPIIERILESGQYVGGEEIEKFEHQAAQMFGVDHVVALNSGTDALVYSLRAVGVGPGDEVITPPNSFVASTASIVQLGARPVFVDVARDQNIDPNCVEAAITRKTKAIMPVHLTGRVADMKAIQEIADHHDISVVEDAAQAVGSSLEGRLSGSWGRVGCFSAHPLKNLNACGDAGFITTNDKNIAYHVRLMRNHGLVGRDVVETFESVSRMDTIQAAVIRFRLSSLQSVIKCRRKNAALYRSILNSDVVFVPPEQSGEFNTWHTFVIQVKKRNQLREFLSSRMIETAVHYPVPIHMQPASRFLGYRKGDFPVTEHQAETILTLPVHQHLQNDQIQLVANAVNEFFES